MKRISRMRGCRGSAMVETAILLPLYMLVLASVIFFGYMTLGMQRLTVASAFAAWIPGNQGADELAGEFWPWTATPEVVISGGSSSAKAGDMRLTLDERIRTGDEYYENEIPAQLAGSSLGYGGDYSFDKERLCVSLWTYALGDVTQSFDFVPGQGAVERMTVNFDDFARYLNDPSGRRNGGGFVKASEGEPPALFWAEPAETGGAYSDLLMRGFGKDWLERRRVEMETDYRPPFFKKLVLEADSPGTTLEQNVTGNMEEPETVPTAVSFSFDITGRGSMRRLDMNNNGALLVSAEGFLASESLPESTSLDSRLKGYYAPGGRR